MNVVLETPSRALEYLKAPIAQDKLIKYQVALRQIQIFGQRYADAFQNKWPSEEFAQIRGACIEIQKRMGDGNANYIQIECPKTGKILRNYPLTVHISEVFNLIKKVSCCLWPFFQRILQYPKPEIEVLNALEKERELGFDVLVKALDIKQNVESSGSPPRQEIAATGLYFGRGALVYKGRVVYFSEIVHMWGSLSQKNQQKHAQFLQGLTLRDQVEDLPKNEPDFLHCSKELTFRQFLIHSSIIAIESNLKVQFSSGVKKELTKVFALSEETRSDFCYFSAYPEIFYQTNFKRFSSSFIRSFQLYFFLSKGFGIPSEEQPLLLNIAVFMRRGVSSEDIPGFLKRTPEPTTVQTFQKAWEGFLKILKAIKKNFSFPEDEALLNSSSAWGLLSFLWKHPEREQYIDLLCKLSELSGFSMTLPTALNFCETNQNEVVPHMPDLFKNTYEKVIQTLTLNNLVLSKKSECIFFDPPIVLNKQTTKEFLFAGFRLERFAKQMKEGNYSFSDPRKYAHMLRKYIFDPQPQKFGLLADCKRIGAVPNEELLFEVLSADFVPFNPPVTSQERNRAGKKAREIQDKYRLSSVHIFSVYVEFLRLERNGQLDFDKIDAIDKTIDILAELCPVLKKTIVFYLFKVHPEVDSEQAAQLSLLRKSWAEDEAELDRFVLSQTRYGEIRDKIEAFVSPLAQASQEMGNPFSAECQSALFAAFFPPLQPIIDALRVTDVTADGISWGDESWKTHEGQLKFVLKGASLGVYCNWSFWKERPVFFFSFYDIKTKVAYSAFIPLNGNEIPSEKRSCFWGLLQLLAQQILPENQPDGNLSEDATNTASSWIGANHQCQEQVELFPEITPPVDFYQKVKISYRKLFLCSAAHRKLDDLPSNKPSIVAAQGHIFPVDRDQRGALLPAELFKVERKAGRAKNFIPDASKGFVQECRPLFDLSTEEAVPLHLKLRTSDGDFPISYQVQSVNEFVGQDVQGKKQNDVAASKKDIEGKYVTLSIDGIRIPLRYPPEALAREELFQKYFDYHNLLLKAAYYFQRTLD